MYASVVEIFPAVGGFAGWSTSPDSRCQVAVTNPSFLLCIHIVLGTKLHLLAKSSKAHPPSFFGFRSVVMCTRNVAPCQMNPSSAVVSCCLYFTGAARIRAVNQIVARRAMCTAHSLHQAKFPSIHLFHVCLNPRRLRCLVLVYRPSDRAAKFHA